MSRYTDADEAREYINEIIPKVTESDYQKGIAVGLTMAKIALKASIVDAVPVVRCKDCKYCDMTEIFDAKTAKRRQQLFCMRYGMDISGDWFCADGEKVSE